MDAALWLCRCTLPWHPTPIMAMAVVLEGDDPAFVMAGDDPCWLGREGEVVECRRVCSLDAYRSRVVGWMPRLEVVDAAA